MIWSSPITCPRTGTTGISTSVNDAPLLFGGVERCRGHAVHVRRGPNGRWRIETLVEGETVREVLSYVQFEPEEMRRQLRHDVEAAIGVSQLALAGPSPREVTW